MAVLRPAGDFDQSYEQDMSILRKQWHVWVTILAITALYLVPLLDNTYLNFTINRIAYTIIALQGLNILTGFTGQISLGQAAFMLVGGYASALLSARMGAPFWISIPLAAVVTGVIGLIFGLPSLRVKGFYLAMATLAAQFIIPWLSRQPFLGEYLGGTDGFIVAPVIEFIVNPLLFLLALLLLVAGLVVRSMMQNKSSKQTSFYLILAAVVAFLVVPWLLNGGETSCVNEEGVFMMPGFAQTCVFPLAETRQFLPLAITFLLLTTLLANNIGRTRLGRAFVAIRDNDLAAELLGVNLFNYKLQAFFIAAVFAGVGGALRAHSQRAVGTELGYTLVESVLFLGMLVIGGLGTNLGPFFGAIFVILVTDFSLWLGPQLAEIFPSNAAALESSFRPIFFGLVLVLFLIFEPRGMAHRWTLMKAAWRLRPFAR